MQRGDVVAIADRAAGDYAGKPRPAVVLQSDLFGATGSVTVCPLTGDEVAAPLLRLRVEPADVLPLRQASFTMVDKITTVRRDRVGATIGRLAAEDMLRLERALVVFLGIG